MKPGTIDAPWWPSAVIYQVYIRSFADGNGDGLGDIAGLRSKLSYIADLGVDAIWINPWYPSPMADAGYDVSDYRAVAHRPPIAARGRPDDIGRRSPYHTGHERHLHPSRPDQVGSAQRQRLRRMPCDRWPLGAPAALYDLRPYRLLRLVARSTHHGPFPRNESPLGPIL
jgi:hypothetical protein